MIGIVIVSHSAKLAEGVCELAAQMAQGAVRLAAAGGTGDPENPFGTDAFKVVRAIESVFDDDGVLVLMDLGSALLSADTALEFLDEEQRSRVRLCAAPLVEGAVAAVGRALAGGGLDEIAREAEAALSGKAAQVGGAGAEAAERLVTLPNQLGLHARPAVQLVRAAARFPAQVTIRNVSKSRGPVDASSINGLLSLAARQADRLALSARGLQSEDALAAVSALIEAGFGEADDPASEAPLQTPVEKDALAGIPASAGIAIGPLRHFRPVAADAAFLAVEDPQRELERLVKAIAGAQDETRHILEWARQRIGDNEAAIFEAQSLFLDDLRERASKRILADSANAEYAWQAAMREAAHGLTELEDPMVRARAADVTDAGERVTRRLAGDLAAPLLEQPGILAARDLAPSQVKDLDPRKALGVCLEASGASAHIMILARAMGIPAVAGLGPAVAAIADGTMVALDGERGLLWVAPDAERLEELEARRAAWLSGRETARAGRHRLAQTRDGRRIRVLANISGVDEAKEALECGAEGVGVLRTEFLFLNRATAPSEDEQCGAYMAIASVLGPRPMVIRTLDVGGDKSLPYIAGAEEANPFLGWRGIRVSLGQRDLFQTQLRAILRASAAGDVEILLPMISSLAEVRAARELLEEAKAVLRTTGVAFNANMKIGVMIEVPSAAVIADQLAREVDFFSIGTNDLAQYLMAADRTNPRVSAMADPLQPAVLRIVRQVVTAAKEARIGVTLCGELAGDPLATALLAGLGLEELSVSAPLIPAVKQAIARISIDEAEAIARDVLLLDSSEAVRRRLAEQAS